VRSTAKSHNQALDDRSPQAILRGERRSAHRREPPRPDRVAIGREHGRVLHVALRQAADRRGAKADQNLSGVRRVALKIAAQPPFPKREGKAVLRQGEMIEADRDVASAREPCGRRLELRRALHRPGQRRLVD
jgi:hypothetical protein